MREVIRLCSTSLRSICECSLGKLRKWGERADGGWKEGTMIRMRNFDFDCRQIK
jgi:hypothetical protein